MYSVFGKQLLKERTEKGLTAQMIADNCDISRSYITLIETGKRLPGKKIILKLATALDIKAGTVLNWYLEDISQNMRKRLKI